MGLKVTFGRQDYEVQPQRIGRLQRKLPEALSLVSTAAGGETPDGIGAQLYSGLKVFIPDLAPEWEVLGYMSREDWEHRSDDDWTETEYDEARDKSPLTSEIDDLLTAIFTINGGDRLVRLLGKVIDPEMVTRQLKIYQATAATAGASKRLQSLQQPNGASVPINSSTTDRTPEPSPSAA